MAITAQQQKNLVSLVVGMFNAVPGATYLNEIAGYFDSHGDSYTATALALSNTDEFQLMYGPSLTSQGFAAKFLATIGLDDNQEAIDWVVGKDTQGQNRALIIVDALTIILNSSSAMLAEAKAILENKTAVGLYYSVELEIGETDLVDLQAALDGVDATPESVAAAKAAIDDIVNPPQQFELTTATDDIHGSAGDDTVVGIVNGASSTFTLGDKIDGGFGDNTLQVLTDQLTVTLLGKTISNIQHFILDNVSDDLDTLDLNSNAFGTVVGNFNSATQVDDLAIININKASTVTINDLDLNGYTAGLVYSGSAAISNVVSLNNVVDGEVDFTFNHGADAAGTFTLNLDGVDDVDLDMSNDGSPTTLNINVSGDSVVDDIWAYSGFSEDSAQVVNLALNADLEIDWIDLSDEEGSTTTLNVTGAGNLTINELDAWEADLTIAGAAATGDLDIFVGGPGLQTATTGGGDDRLSLERGYFVADSELVVNLGAGSNTLAVHGGSWDEGATFTDEDISGLLFTDTSITSAQTLEIEGNVELDEGNATLDLEGVDGVATVFVNGWLQGNGNTLTFPGPVADDEDTEEDETDLIGSPETLTLTAAGSIDWLYLNTGDVSNLTVNAAGELDIDGITSDALTSLTLGQTDNEGGVVWLDLDGADDNLSTLATLNVAGENSVNIDIVGSAGDDSVPATGGSIESGSFTFSAYNKNTGTFSGNVLISSASLPTGSLLVDVTGSSNANAVASTVAAALAAVTGIGASASTGTVNYTWDAVGNQNDIVASFIPTGDDTLTATNNAVTQGTNPTEEIPATNGSGFEALASVVVDSGETASVDMTDAFGNFTFSVTAADDAYVNLTNTGVTSLAVDAGDYAGVFVGNAQDMTTATVSGTDVSVWIDDASVTAITLTADATEDDMGEANLFVVDTPDLVSITATAWFADIEADGDQDSLATIDISGVVDAANVDVVDAEFGGEVTVIIGDEDLTYTTDATNAVREDFDFVGTDTGTVAITGFFLSVGGTGDRLDFSDMAGIDAIDDLEIVLDGGNTVITSLVDGVDVDITVVGVDLTTDAYHFVF